MSLLAPLEGVLVGPVSAATALDWPTHRHVQLQEDPPLENTNPSDPLSPASSDWNLPKRRPAPAGGGFFDQSRRQNAITLPYFGIWGQESHSSGRAAAY